MRNTSHPVQRSCIAATALAALLTSTALAQENSDELAKKLSNPVASLISVPFQYNVDFDIGPEDGTRHTLNIQPVIPASLNADWTLITRVIAPVIYQDNVFGNSGDQFGLGDLTPTFFFSPKEPIGGWIIGAGPVFLLRTATDELLGAEKWGAGPSVVTLKQTPDGWTIGMLANHIWSVAGDDERADISSTFLQPFLAKQFPGARTLTVNLESTYDWKGKDWNVPVNLVYSKVTRLGSHTVSFAGGARYYAETPGDGPDWGLRFVFTLLIPQH